MWPFSGTPRSHTPSRQSQLAAWPGRLASSQRRWSPTGRPEPKFVWRPWTASRHSLMGNIWWSQGKGSKTWKTGPNGTVCNNLGHITYRYAVCVPINIGTESSLWACMGNGLCARKWQMFYGKWHSIVSVPSSLTSSLQDHTHTTGWGNYNHHPGVGTGPRGTPSCQQFCLCAPTQPGLKLWGQRWVFFLQNILLGVSVFEIILPLDYPVVNLFKIRY